MSFYLLNSDALIEDLYFIFDTDDGIRTIVVPYDINADDIEKRIRGYIDLLDVFHGNSSNEHEFWFNLGMFFKTKQKIHSIIDEDAKYKLEKLEKEFVHKMQKRIKIIREEAKNTE